MTIPNRILKESICTSEDIDKLSPQAEILFYRLIVRVDDYGLYFGNEKLIKSICYPLKSSDISDEQLKSWLLELQSVGLLFFYYSGGKRYLKLSSWAKHQQIRAKKSKFPIPNDADIIRNQMISDDCNSHRNPIQFNPIGIENTIQKELSSEQDSDDEIPDKKPTKQKRIFSDDSTEMKLSKLLFKKMRENNPTCKEPNFQDWCKNIDFMIRLDEREPKAIQDMILFSQWEPFWKTVILSTGKLREKYDKLEIKRLGELAKSEERSV